MARLSRRSYRNILFVLPILMIYGVATSFFQQQQISPEEYLFPSRKLLQVDETESSETDKVEETDEALFPVGLFTDHQLSHGAVILYIIGVVYMFYALALVCDEFFVPSLDVISEKLGISSDVAGATFMAAGGSAPELFTSIIGIFIAKTDVGIGTVVGSAVFNILFVIAACAFAAKTALSLTAWPLIRDVSFYSTSLLLLVVFFLDNFIQWWEALTLFLMYIAYVSFMAVNQRVEDGLRALFRMEKVNHESADGGIMIRKAACRKGLYHLMNETINKDILEKRRALHQQEGEEMKPLKPKGIMIMSNTAGEAGGESSNPSAGGISQLKNHLRDGVDEPTPDTKLADVEKAEDENPEGEEPIDMSFPIKDGWKKILIYIVSFPIMGPLYLTLPDTKNPEKKKYCIITFCLSIAWIALYSYFMVWWATVIGDVIRIPPPVMGLTFLAAGTSVPDLITSVLVAKQGKGDMAVSSSVGSNIFDVTVGLPFPWLLYSIIYRVPIKVSSAGVGCSVAMLFSMLIVVFISIVAFRWKMTKGMGVVMMCLYLVFVIISLGFSYQLYSCPI